MRDSKSIVLLRTFSDDDMKAFGRFIGSAFFNPVKKLELLFGELKKFHPSYSSGYLSYEKLHARLFGKKPFSKQVMWNLSSLLEKKLKEFLIQQTLKKDPVMETELLLKAYGSRKILYNFQHTLDNMERMLSEKGVDYSYFENRLHLEHAKNEYLYLTDKVQFMGDSMLRSSEYQIMLFLRMTVGALRDLKILEEYHNYRTEINIPLEVMQNLELDKIVDYANKNEFRYAYLLELYYRSLMMLQKPKETAHMERYRELYNEHFMKLSKNEQSDMMHWLINYCLYNLDLREMRHRRTVFELNEFRLKEGLVFYPENQLSKAMYLQILNTALDADETKWAQNFINEYTVRLLPGIRESMRCMANAYLYFHTKDYEKVIKNLNKVEFVDIRDKLQTRMLAAKSYYELGETQTLLHYIDASKHFLVKNPSVSEIFRIYTHNFFKYLNKIVLAIENKNSAEIGVLKNEISNTLEVTNKHWLLTKLNELESV
jgi:hypothetical protein